MDMQRMREDGFLDDVEASLEDEAERQEMAPLRQMRACRPTASRVSRGMPGLAEDRVHAEAQAAMGDLFGRGDGLALRQGRARRQAHKGELQGDEAARHAEAKQEARPRERRARPQDVRHLRDRRMRFLRRAGGRDRRRDQGEGGHDAAFP